ncbi:MAG: hypothetical protein ACYS1A_07670 [Planctomycetota bacterium]
MNKKRVHILVGIIWAGLIIVTVLIWLQGKEEGKENICPAPNTGVVAQKNTFKSNKIAENTDISETSLELDKNNELDATVNKFIDQSTTEIVQESKALVKHPVHEGRKTLMDKIKTESFEECFMHTTDTYGLCMMIPSFGGFFFSPGHYSSDVMMIRSMDRMRKLVEFAKRNPSECAIFLERQIREIGNSFDLHYKKFLEEIKDRAGSSTRKDLRQIHKDIIHLTVAVYLLSENNLFDSLPTLLSLSKSNGMRRKSPDEPREAGSWPINPQFLIYSMHRLVVNFPENLLNEQALQVRAEYLKKADELQIPHPETVEVTTWDSPYKEDDYRFQLPKVKREMYLRSQKEMNLTVYPLDIKLNKSNDVEALLDKLENFCTIAFSNAN